MYVERHNPNLSGKYIDIRSIGDSQMMISGKKFKWNGEEKFSKITFTKQSGMKGPQNSLNHFLT